MPFPAMALVVIILASMAASTAWRLAGNSMYFIATPSMCPSLCVGSLAIDTPVGTALLRVGETISFHPPGVTQVYTHRIVKIAENGQAISTKGVAASKPDPWTITPTDVEGVTVASAGTFGPSGSSKDWCLMAGRPKVRSLMQSRSPLTIRLS